MRHLLFILFCIISVNSNAQFGFIKDAVNTVVDAGTDIIGGGTSILEGGINEATPILDGTVGAVLKPSGDVLNVVIMKPTEQILNETDHFLNNVTSEIKRKIEDGTVTYIAVWVASYYIGGPAVFELAGWQQITGATIISLVVGNAINNAVAENIEKAAVKGIEEANKTLEPIINTLTDYMCSLSGVNKENCNFSFVLNIDYDKSLTAGLGHDYKDYYFYYKANYNQAKIFNNQLSHYKAEHLHGIEVILKSQKIDDPITEKLLGVYNSSFLSAEYAAYGLFDSNLEMTNMDTSNLLALYHNARSSYEAVKYVFTHEYFTLEDIEDMEIRNKIVSWSSEKDGKIFLNNQLLQNEITEQANAIVSRSPASFGTIVRLGLLGFILIEGGNRVIELNKTSDMFVHYYPIASELAFENPREYGHLPAAMFKMFNNKVVDAAIMYQKDYVGVLRLFSRLRAARLSLSEVQMLLDKMKKEEKESLKKFSEEKRVDQVQ